MAFSELSLMPQKTIPYRIENRRYTGSKAKLAGWIIGLIERECSGKIFADIFAGTGIISATASSIFDHIIVNDFLYSNHACYKAFFGRGVWDKEKLEDILMGYNRLNADKIKPNYFSDNFGGKYFSDSTAKKVGYIRDSIEKCKNNLTEKEYYILLVSLLYAVDKCANTVGHYDAYFRKTLKENGFFPRLIEPIKVKKATIYREDANLLSKDLRADIVYIDPPYNSRQYSRFYHLLETLIKWDHPKLYGVALKPTPENMSDYCRVTAAERFAGLIKSLKCKHIIVSYNNTYASKSNSSKNKITLEKIKEILDAKGTTKIFKKAYRFFNSGKTNFENHHEFVFTTKVSG